MYKPKKLPEKVTKPKNKLWEKFKRSFSFKSKTSEVVPDIQNPLEDVTLDQLKVEIIDADEQTMPDIEIAFINPTTGELEVITLPQDTFKIKVEEHPTQEGDESETVVMLELEMPVPNDEDEDPTKRITHFLPNSRLH